MVTASHRVTSAPRQSEAPALRFTYHRRAAERGAARIALRIAGASYVVAVEQTGPCTWSGYVRDASGLWAETISAAHIAGCEREARAIIASIERKGN